MATTTTTTTTLTPVSAGVNKRGRQGNFSPDSLSPDNKKVILECEADARLGMCFERFAEKSMENIVSEIVSGDGMGIPGDVTAETPNAAAFLGKPPTSRSGEHDRMGPVRGKLAAFSYVQQGDHVTEH